MSSGQLLVSMTIESNLHKSIRVQSLFITSWLRNPLKLHLSKIHKWTKTISFNKPFPAKRNQLTMSFNPLFLTGQTKIKTSCHNQDPLHVKFNVLSGYSKLLVCYILKS